ncbi:MAG: hypothetical protein HY051_01735 [Candidatus Aenigmarchaeota archaeon]|nr:hypothetical protein [Candidatus Aenigmarchaeota archaeon]
MRTPICSVCLQSDILCKSCARNIEAGKISALGAGIIKNLYELSRKVKSVDSVNIEKVLDFDSLVVIICQKSDVPNLVGRGGRITGELRKKFGKQIKVIGRDQYKQMIADLVFPARIEGIGKLYSGGVESLKINVQKNQLMKLPAKREDLLKAAAEISGMKVEFANQ